MRAAANRVFSALLLAGSSTRPFGRDCLHRGCPTYRRIGKCVCIRVLLLCSVTLLTVPQVSSAAKLQAPSLCKDGTTVQRMHVTPSRQHRSLVHATRLVTLDFEHRLYLVCWVSRTSSQYCFLEKGASLGRVLHSTTTLDARCNSCTTSLDLKLIQEVMTRGYEVP
jgi:hypothetical protein